MAQRDSGYDRKPRDLYQTAPWATDVIARYLLARRKCSPARFKILEPAAGPGKMVRQLRANGFRCVLAADIHPHRGLDYVEDFHVLATRMACTAPGNFPDAVITNPPYGDAEAFIETALSLTRPSSGLVAMLLKVDFDSGKTRQHLFGLHPAWGAKIVLLDRIEWFKPKRKGAGPSENHAWFIWDWTRKPGPPITLYDGRADSKVAA